MSTAVNSWKQAGRLFLWRYPPLRKKHAGWHLTAEDEACDSLIALIEAMRAERQDSRRTIAVTAPPEAVWSVPNIGAPIREAPGPLTLTWDPAFDDLTLLDAQDRLSLRVGDRRADDLLAGLKDIRRGEGDYALAPTDARSAPPIWFWWMPWSGRR